MPSRAHLDEDIVQDRELLQIDRAVQGLKALLDDLLRYAGKLKATIESESGRIDDQLTARQDEESRLNLLIDRDAAHFRESLHSMARETSGWLNQFFDRLEKKGSQIAGFAFDDLQKHFPFFVADSLRMAIHQCLDTHRPLIVQEMRQVRTPATAVRASAVGTALHYDLAEQPADQSGLRQSASEATSGSVLWERLDTSQLLSDLAQDLSFRHCHSADGTVEVEGARSTESLSLSAAL